MTAEEELPYERALELFDERLQALENGNLSLEDALKAVDEARVYLRVCEMRLGEAKSRIEVQPAEPIEVRPAEPGAEAEPEISF